MECQNIPKVEELKDQVEKLTTEVDRLSSRIEDYKREKYLYQKLYKEASDMIRQLSLKASAVH